MNSKQRPARCYKLLKDKGNIIQRNRHHLIKSNWNFVKIENDSNTENYIEIEPKTRHSTLVRELGEVDEPQENVIEHRETSSYTTQSGKRGIKPSRHGE